MRDGFEVPVISDKLSKHIPQFYHVISVLTELNVREIVIRTSYVLRRHNKLSSSWEACLLYSLATVLFFDDIFGYCRLDVGSDSGSGSGSGLVVNHIGVAREERHQFFSRVSQCGYYFVQTWKKLLIFKFLGITRRS